LVYIVITMEVEMKDNVERDRSLDQVYKSCSKDWIVTLQPVEGTITNIGRDEHKFDPNLITKSVTSSCYDKKSLTYEIGEIVSVEDYDMDPDNCSSGIHFFLTKETAFSYEMPTDEYLKHLSGCYIIYYNNGRRLNETIYENGCKLAESEYADSDDCRVTETIYENYGDIESRRCISHYDTKGIMRSKRTYIRRSTRHGPNTEYYESGSKRIEANYDNGKLSGSYIEFSEDGASVQKFYENGILLVEQSAEQV
jgi:antitoxin component YwqK of YwqJK toxin-antitoxin module